MEALDELYPAFDMLIQIGGARAWSFEFVWNRRSHQLNQGQGLGCLRRMRQAFFYYVTEAALRRADEHALGWVAQKAQEFVFPQAPAIQCIAHAALIGVLGGYLACTTQPKATQDRMMRLLISAGIELEAEFLRYKRMYPPKRGVKRLKT